MSNTYDWYFDPRLMEGIPYDYATGTAPAPNAGLLDPIAINGYPLPQAPAQQQVPYPRERPAQQEFDPLPPMPRERPVQTYTDVSGAERQPSVQAPAPPRPAPASQQPTSWLAGLLPAPLRGTDTGGLFGMGSVDQSQWMPNMGLLGAGAAMYEGKGWSEAAKAMMAGAQFDQKNRIEAQKAQRDAALRQIMANAPKFADGTPDYSGVANQLLRAGADPDTIGKFLEFSRKGLESGQRYGTSGAVEHIPGALPAMEDKTRATTAPELKQGPDGQWYSVDKYGGRGAGGRPAAVPVEGVPGGQPFDKVMDLRKEIGALPEVKRYSEAIVPFRSMTQSSKLGHAPSDLDFVYGIAKIFDPESVVREGEMKLVGAAQSIPDALKGAMHRAIYGGEALSPQVKQQILEVTRVRMSELQNSYQERLEPYRGIAGRYQVRETDVFPTLPALPELAPRPAAGDTTTPPAPTVRTVAPGQRAGPAPRPGDVVNGMRFKGGNPRDPNNWEPATAGGR